MSTSSAEWPMENDLFGVSSPAFGVKGGPCRAYLTDAAYGERREAAAPEAGRSAGPSVCNFRGRRA